MKPTFKKRFQRFLLNDNPRIDDALILFISFSIAAIGYVTGTPLH